jgi:hypothetical protein
MPSLTYHVGRSFDPEQSRRLYRILQLTVVTILRRNPESCEVQAPVNIKPVLRKLDWYGTSILDYGLRFVMAQPSLLLTDSHRPRQWTPQHRHACVALDH